MSIKALLSMAMFLSGTTDSKTMMLLLSSATRQFRMLSGLDSFQEPAVVEDKQRTISVAYLLEETCFSNCGFRLATSNSISEIHLPQKIEQQRTAGVDHGTPFWPRVELAIIESNAQKLLQKAKSPSEILENQILTLGQQLEAWRQSLPPTIRPQYNPPPGSEPSELPAVMLHCAFYRSLDNINRAYHLCKLHQPSASYQSLAPQLETQGPLDVSRATIRLFRHMGDICYTDLW
jgi:hypothetical protein